MSIPAFIAIHDPSLLAFEEVKRKCQIFVVTAVSLPAVGGVMLLAGEGLRVREVQASERSVRLWGSYTVTVTKILKF